MALKSKQKKIIYVATAIVTVLLIVAASFFVYTVSQGSKQVTTDDQTRRAAGIPTAADLANRQQLDSQALAAAKDKGAAGGQAVYDTQLNATSDKKQQAVIYSQKAAFASSPSGGNDLKSALDYAYKAEGLAPDYGTAILIAQLEESLKDIPNAVKYYKLYLARLNPEAIALNPGDKEAYEAKVLELEKQL